jgi:hypothetical protein
MFRVFQLLSLKENLNLYYVIVMVGMSVCCDFVFSSEMSHTKFGSALRAICGCGKWELHWCTHLAIVCSGN